jgi:S-adenosylmethionine:tRNA ribosyltransferase-isomerase
VRAADFDYDLPTDLIARKPLGQRDQSRLLVLRRDDPVPSHHRFPDLLRFLKPTDVLVLNDSRVIPARLFGFKAGSGGQIEMLLLEENDPNDWWVMLRPGKRVRVGTTLELLNRTHQRSGISAAVMEENAEGHRRLRFSGTPNIFDDLDQIGEVPLPPYIRRTSPVESAEDRSRYQTVFARQSGSVAAPTAGFHFTNRMFGEIRALGVNVSFLTLHVGLGTFAPVKANTLEHHVMHEERFRVDAETARTINHARRAGGRIVAVGTTTVRVLESVAAANHGQLAPTEGRTRIFIHPPCPFRIVDALITNFHLPRSTLLMLVSAFASPGETRGRELILNTYAEAIRQRYRFYSYGDAMLII